MTDMQTASRAALSLKLAQLLSTDPYNMQELRERRDELGLREEYPGFVVWGPEIQPGDQGMELVMYIWSWEGGEKRVTRVSAAVPTDWVIEGEEPPAH